jgi:hypothetical protein
MPSLPEHLSRLAAVSPQRKSHRKEGIMESNAQRLSPAIFVLALICFFLPFVTFSCQGQKVMSFSGIQLVTGTTIQEPQMFGPPQSQKLNPQPLAVLAFVCGVLGLALSFVRGRARTIAPAVAGGVAAILLMALKSSIDSDVLSKGGGVIQANYDIGFYVVVLLLLAAVGLNVFLLIQGRGLRFPVLTASSRDKFCTQCGSRNLGTDVFCKECGAKFT